MTEFFRQNSHAMFHDTIVEKKLRPVPILKEEDAQHLLFL